jgi:hypothetical protein
LCIKEDFDVLLTRGLEVPYSKYCWRVRGAALQRPARFAGLPVAFGTVQVAVTAAAAVWRAGVYVRKASAGEKVYVGLLA